MSTFEALVAKVEVSLAGACGVSDGVPLLAAVSGGADSMVLLRCLSHLQRRWPLAGAVFVDHGLRDVSEELACTRQTAAELGVTLVIRSVRLPESGNMQQNARRARYAVLTEEANPKGCLVCTGHTASDLAETVLERLMRGAGLRGLRGIPHRRDIWVRPMLDVTRDEVRALKFPWVDDPTNASDAYLRNRIRHQVLPVLRRENPNIEHNLSQVARAAAAELALLDALSELVSDEVDLTDAPPALVEALVRWRLRREVSESPPPRRRAVEQLARRLVEGVRGRVSLGGGVAGVSRAGVLDLVADEDGRTTISAPGPGHYSARFVSMTVSATPETCVVDEPPEQRRQVCLIVSAADIKWPITLRRWRLGDSQGNAGQWRLIDGVGKVFWRAGVDDNPGRAEDEDGVAWDEAAIANSKSGNSLFIRLRFLSR